MKSKRLCLCWITVFAMLGCLGAGLPVTGQQLPTQDVNQPELRKKQGLHPGEKLLFSGWGLTPAGRHIPVTDLALKMVIAPDNKFLIAVHGGFNQHGVTVIDLAAQKEAQFLPLERAWNGLAVSSDGHRFFVSGGASAAIHEFTYNSGKAVLERSIQPAGPDEEAFLAGLAVLPRTGKVCMCNEASHEIWILDGNTLAIEKRIPVGQHPHSCVLGL